MATTVDFVTEYQNLNSGNLLMNGLNSSFDLVGNSGPSPSAISFQVKLTFRVTLTMFPKKKKYIKLFKSYL